MTDVLHESSGRASGIGISPIPELLADIRRRDGLQTLGGFAVIRTNFDRTVDPGVALYWLDGVGFGGEDEGKIFVASHSFVGAGVGCELEACGKATIDLRLSEDDSLVKASGKLSNLDAVGQVLERIRADDEEGNGNPMANFLSRVVLLRFERLDHDFFDPSGGLREAAWSMLVQADRIPDYYNAGLNHLYDPA